MTFGNFAIFCVLKYRGYFLLSNIFEEEAMDFLAKHREYVFYRHQKVFRTHTKLLERMDHEIWVMGQSKKYRKTAEMVDLALNKINDNVIPPIVIVDAQKFEALCAYNAEEDVIFVSNKLYSKNVIDQNLNSNYFASKDMIDMLKHEIGHRLHRQAAKRYYFAHQSRYNNVNEAKNDLDARIEKIVKNEMYLDRNFLIDTLSFYANDQFRYTNQINDVVAEFCVKEYLPNKYKKLENTIKEMLSYGKDGYHGIAK